MVRAICLIARLMFHEPDGIFVVDFHDLERDLLVAARGDVHAGIIGHDRHLAVSAVDEYGALDCFRSAEIRKRVESGAHRAAGIQHVVDKDHVDAVDVEGYIGDLDRRLSEGSTVVVAVKRDVQDAGRKFDMFEGAYFFCDALRQKNAARLHAHDAEIMYIEVFFQDLVGDARQGPVERLRVHEEFDLLHWIVK
jgi:hypothetical protein